VRFRHFAPVLGRWLTRDPAGYVDGMHLYSYLSSSPITSVDPTGLFDAAGHYFGTYIATICAGKPLSDALNLAYYAQYPDQVRRYDALELWKRWMKPSSTSPTPWMYEVMRTVHSLDGGDAVARRACLSGMLRNGKLTSQEAGTILHAYGDAFAHTYIRLDGVEVSYIASWGHGLDTALNPILGSCPDNACSSPDRLRKYMASLCQTLGGSSLRCTICLGRLNLAQIPSADPTQYLPWFRDQAVEHYNFPKNGWMPGSFTTNPIMPPIRIGRMLQIMKLMQCACPTIKKEMGPVPNLGSPM
jgi:hypothetical protein